MRTRVSVLAATLLAGPVTGALGLAAGHLTASLLKPASSPVLAVGSFVIDRTPTPVKDWAIAHFGTHDKTILVGSVLLGVLALSLLIGLLARRRWWVGALGFVALSGIAAACVLTRPTAAATDVVPSVVTRSWRSEPCGCSRPAPGRRRPGRWSGRPGRPPWRVAVGAC